MKQCPNCGYNIPDNELFCAHCGMRVSFTIENKGNKASLRSTYIFRGDYNDVSALKC